MDDETYGSWKMGGRDSLRAINKTGIQESSDPTMQSIGDIASYTSAGAAIGGPYGAIGGASIGVIKSAFNYADSRKKERELKRAKQKKERRMNAMRQQEMGFRKKELAASRDNKRYNRQQDIDNQRINGANAQYQKLQTMMGNNQEFRRYMIENGYA